MVAGNFCHVNESDDDDDDDKEEKEAEEDKFRFYDALIYEGHMRKNGLLTCFFIQKAKTISHIIKSEIP